MLMPNQSAKPDSARGFSREFSLILQLIQDADNIEIDETIDFSLFMDLLQRHRIKATIASLIKERESTNTNRKLAFPTNVRSQLNRFHQTALIKDFSTIVEIKQLQQIFKSENIPLTLLKGLTLSHSSYEGVGWRDSYDIDILVDRKHTQQADQLLHTNGYERFEPSLNITQKAWSKWQHQRKDAAYRHKKTGSVIELHWRLFDNPYILPEPHETQQDTLLNQLECTRFSPRYEFAYVCTHASQHAYSRLKWLIDIYFIIKKTPPETLADYIDNTVDTFAKTAMLQSLFLCAELFSFNTLPTDQFDLTKAGLRHRLLTWIAKTTMTRGGAQEIEQIAFGTTLKTVSHYMYTLKLNILAAELSFDIQEKINGRSSI